MPFVCSICEEESNRICVLCTKDTCSNHLCERCGCCSDCCACEVPLDEHLPPESVHAPVHAPEHAGAQPTVHPLVHEAAPKPDPDPEPEPPHPPPDPDPFPGEEPEPDTGPVMD
jgi:hypothetical protein